MNAPPPLPLPAAELPESVRKFGSPEAPAPARMMAAKGLVPVKGHDLVLLLLQLSNDADEGLAKTAASTLVNVPDGVLFGACEASLPPSFLHALAERYTGRDEVLSRLAQNRATPVFTLQRLARTGSEALTEIIAVNQQRLLSAPDVIEALYLNKRTRMSTADRLVELAARNGVDLPNVPTFKQHVEAIKGQLIPEPTDEPLPTDTMFQDVLAQDADDDVVDRDEVEGTETVKPKYTSLSFQIREMNIGEKLRLSVVGDAVARALLVRDPNKIIQLAAISSPATREPEVVAIAHSKEVSEDVLRFIGNRKEWLKSHEIKRALVFNPKTPVAISMGFLAHLRVNDLRALARSRGVSNALKTMARQRLDQKGNK